MSEIEKKVLDGMDWKEFSRKLLFEGTVPAVKMITDLTKNKVDDSVINVLDLVGRYLTDEETEA